MSLPPPGTALLVGVGSGVAALGDYLLDAGWEIAVADDDPSRAAEYAATRGVRAVPVDRIGSRFDLAVRSAAVDAERIDGVAAQTLSYPEALGAISRSRTTIAIAGTHGKSTCAALLAHLMPRAGCIAGLPIDGRGGRFGDPDAPVIIEACEFRRHFLALRPHTLAVLAIEHDHPDCFADRDEVVSAFAALHTQATGAVLSDEPLARAISFDAGPIEPLIADSPLPSPLHPSLRAAVCLARMHGVADEAIARRLRTLPELPLRLQRVVAAGRVRYHDYAHHPTAVAATLGYVRQAHPGRIVHAIFEPHQMARLAAMGEAFADALAIADRITVLPVFAARECVGEFERITASRRLAEACGGAVAADCDAAAASCDDDEVVVVMGAGPIHRILGPLLDRGMVAIAR